MAEEHQIEARILLRYDTYSHWMNSTLILLKGEAAICSFPYKNTIINSNSIPENTPPAIGIKIGDGEHYFYELPWVQSVAADVYNWAKTADKPQYEASEIIGLAEYITAHSQGGSGGESGHTGTVYRITYNDKSAKYILQVYNNDEGYWEDTDSEIDFSAVLGRLNALERWANGYTTNIGDLELPLNAYIYDAFIIHTARLTVEDTAEPHQFVTAVSETNGKIQVTRKELAATDITNGVLPTEYGGTGLEFVEEGKVLVGSITGQISTKNYNSVIDTNDRESLATSGAIINYVEKATAGLTGAMHFIGEATVVITNDSSVDPQINGYNFKQAAPGDVILGINKEEYVWTGSNWRLLGDEGSYAVKGSITNADIADGAEINIGKIADLSNLLDNKVDKIEGKELSTNDFTNEYKNKLEDIENQAQRNLIEHIYINDTEVQPATIDNVPNVISFRMSSLTEEEAEQLRQTSEKVQNIEANAQVNKIESISIDGDKQIPDAEKNINLELNQYTNIIESISLNNGVPLPIIGKNVNINLDESALAFEVITGAEVPSSNNNDKAISVINKKLQLARIAKTGSIYDIADTSNKYTIPEQQQEDFIILNCGSSTKLIDNIIQTNN